jgi:hydroxypyruvate reductase
VVTLAISDVPGDDPAAIASGPTVPDPTAHQDLTALLAKLPDVPKPAQDIIARTHDEAQLENVDFRLIAAPFSALETAAGVAREHGVTPLILGDALEGEARELGTAMAGIASSVALHGQPVKRPAVLLSGGETTVTIGKTKPGRGGRNTEFLLALGVALNGQDGIHAIACDTDGIDGTEDAAGAIIGPDFLDRCNTANADPKGRLAAHDSYGLFEEINGLVVTGPTCTNVNDFRAVLIL